MNVAKMPTTVHDTTSMTSIQKLSWIAGQWYLWTWPTCRSTTNDPEVTVDAIAAAAQAPKKRKRSPRWN